MNRTDDIRDNEPGDTSKRRFLQLAGGGIAGLGLAGISMNASAGDDTIEAASNLDAGRRTQAYQRRLAAARSQKIAFEFEQITNGDEAAIPNYAACYSKGLPHNDLGEVDAGAYRALLKAARSGKSVDLAAVPMGAPGAKLINSRAGFNFSLYGPDAQGLTIAPPAAFSSAEIGADMAEAYWGALTRDVPFIEYDDNSLLGEAAADLAKQPGYQGPANPSPDNLFRIAFPGVLDGPWLSQFFWMPLANGPYSSEQVLKPPVVGVDFGATYEEWLSFQRGAGGSTPAGTTARYVATARDLTRVLQLDVPFGSPFVHEHQAFLNLLRLGVPRNPFLPALAPNDNAGENLGPGLVPQLIGQCGSMALQPVFWQKWQVHRRLRPEAYGGRVHNVMRKFGVYPVSNDLLNSAALQKTFSKQGTYLLSQAWKGGCPAHPSYPSAHSVVAGSTVTVLKAFYNGDTVIANPVVANADGSALLPYSGATLTIEGELNKLAANIGMSRIHNGIHYRSDSVQGLLLGERIALNFLAELRTLYADAFEGFHFRGFDGSSVTV
ncbi:vanadium-dependent haloperoxidase [Rudaea sp.]|uniref:vanadium-dependent haloperoxidase n=1 Tax=Rudaea sp. TaxID=2136325 RepID=UPI002ED39EAA